MAPTLWSTYDGDMKNLLALAVFALASTDSTCGLSTPATGTGGSTAFVTECTGPSLRAFTCTFHYYLGCTTYNVPVIATDSVCSTDSSTALKSDDLKLAHYFVSGGLSGLAVLSCTLGTSVQWTPPTTDQAAEMCTPTCYAMGGVCTSQTDCCSGSCNIGAADVSGTCN
jgi:hypothetical protein